MKKVIALLFVLITSYGFAQQSDSFSKKLELAQTEHKPVLLYFSGSDWCAPCVKFKKYIVNTDEFKKYATENLILYNADFPRLSKNKLAKEVITENEALAEKYNAKGLFPLILLLDENGNVLKKWEQYPTESLPDFIAQLHK